MFHQGALFKHVIDVYHINRAALGTSKIIEQEKYGQSVDSCFPTWFEGTREPDTAAGHWGWNGRAGNEKNTAGLDCKNTDRKISNNAFVGLSNGGQNGRGGAGFAVAFLWLVCGGGGVEMRNASSPPNNRAQSCFPRANSL